MSKTTTTLYEYVESELKRQDDGSEFLVDGRLNFYNDTYMARILNFDDDVYEKLTQQVFKGFKYQDEDVDREFKQTFMMDFLDREIGRQTVEAFAAQVLATTIKHREYIYFVFSELEKYMRGESYYENLDSSNNTSTEEHREANATLPQNQVNINVDYDELDFADENKIWKDKNTDTKENNQSGQKMIYDPENLSRIYDMKERIFTEFDKQCFLQIW